MSYPKLMATSKQLLVSVRVYWTNVASQVSNNEPANMEDAINNARWCQHVQQAVFGKKKERNRKSDDDSTFFFVSKLVSTSQTVPNTQRRVSSNPSEGSVETLIENLRQEMNRKLENVNAGFSTPNPRNVSAGFNTPNPKGRGRGRGRGRGSRTAPADLECSVCGELLLGHYARDCEKKLSRSKSRQELNDRGSGVGPNHDPIRYRPLPGGISK